MVIQLDSSDPVKKRRRYQGSLIRKMREINELSIAEFAETLEVTPGAVSQWECGRFTPRPHIQVAIAKTLNVPHSAIFGLDREIA